MLTIHMNTCGRGQKFTSLFGMQMWVQYVSLKGLFQNKRSKFYITVR